MRVEDLGITLTRKLKNNGLVINAPAGTELMQNTESRLNVKFPEPVKLFYTFYNGLSVNDPHFEILSLEKLNWYSDHLIHFATFNFQHKACFDISKQNSAGQWMIVNGETGFQITMTMESFWSNKLLAWVEKRRPVWEQEEYKS